MEDSLAGAAHIRWKFSDCLQHFKPDVVHFHTPQYFPLCLISKAHGYGVKTVVTLHDWWWICPTQFFSPQAGERCAGPNGINCQMCIKKNGYLTSIYKRWKSGVAQVEESTDRFVCVSRILEKDIITAKPYLSKKLSVIPNAVAVEPLSERDWAGPISFAFLGGESQIKGYDQVIRGFLKLNENDPPWRLFIYGCTPVRWTVRSIFSKIKRYFLHPLKLAQKINQKYIIPKVQRGEHAQIFHKPPFSADERGEILQNVQVVLVFSLVQESFSLATYEAMANGCCVITTPCGGPAEVVEDGVNGILLKDFTSDSLTEAVRRMLADPPLVRRLQHGAQVTAERFCNVRQVTEQYLEVYADGKTGADRAGKIK